MRREDIDTVVVGGGQAGLSISYYLTKQNRERVVLERESTIGSSWRSRWDSFTLVTPNWMLRLPGFPYEGYEPDGFLARDEVVRYLEDYAELFDPPIRFQTTVRSVHRDPEGTRYMVETDHTTFRTRDVVVATGSFQEPKIPPASAKFPDNIVQIHSSEYRSPERLPRGAVLVVGSGQSGCQIAEELSKSGRKVYLCVGSAGRIPRRYRGREMAWWLNDLGWFDETVDKLPSPKAKFEGSQHLTGKNGGYDLNLHQFAREGVVLLGRLRDVHHYKVVLHSDLKENLVNADKLASDLKTAIDEYIDKKGFKVPRGPDRPELRDGYDAESMLELDLKSAGIRSVVWATGYSFDYAWVDLPVFDEDGYPIQKRGVTKFPGLYFLGLHWLHTGKSGLLFGVGEDAEYVASAIASRSVA